jgi:hypothetical protein
MICYGVGLPASKNLPHFCGHLVSVRSNIGVLKIEKDLAGPVAGEAKRDY